MRNEHLKLLLNELPRHEASDRFTASVAKLLADSRPSSSEKRWRLALVTAAATIAIVAGATHLALEQRDEARIDVLEHQRRQLQAEIATMRHQTEFDAVIDLGQEDGVRYILDLRPAEAEPNQTVSLQPAFY